MQEYRMQIKLPKMHFNVKLQKARVQNANQIAQNGDLNAKKLVNKRYKLVNQIITNRYDLCDIRVAHHIIT